MKKPILIAIDGSYMQYHSIFRAIRLWAKGNRFEASGYLTPRADGSQSNLIDSKTFRSELYKSFLHTCYVIPEIIESNFSQFRGLDIRAYSDIVFCADDYTTNGFRRKLYEDYKGGRAESRAKNPYDLMKIKSYFTTLFDETDVWNRCGYKYAFVEGAEADDIIFKLMTTYGKDYDNRIVFSSDHDLLQIPDTIQFDLNDKFVKREGKYGPLTSKDFLLRKIIIGDDSDNIPQVFDRIGLAKAERMIRDGSLKQKLAESKSALEQFQLNMQLMDISKMPKELSDKIDAELKNLLFDGNDYVDLDNEIEGMLGDAMTF